VDFRAGNLPAPKRHNSETGDFKPLRVLALRLGRIVGQETYPLLKFRNGRIFFAETYPLLKFATGCIFLWKPGVSS
jgi:hypothetical protein